MILELSEVQSLTRAEYQEVLNAICFSENILSIRTKDAIESGMKRSDCKSAEEYIHLLKSSEHERSTLRSDIVRERTGFFRDELAFSHLAECVAQTRRDENNPFRILSVQCGAGEEPYSIVMSLFSRDVPSCFFNIWATDWSESLLLKMRDARYGSQVFPISRHKERGQFFNIEGDSFLLREELKSLVCFRHSDVVGDTFGEVFKDDRFDAVFLRDILMYLSPKGRATALDNVLAVLKPGGLLFVGRGETNLICGKRLLCEGAASSGCFRSS